MHRDRYGYLLDTQTLEWVQLRVYARSHPADLRLAPAEEALSVEGPHILSQYSATLYIAPGWFARQGSGGDLHCTRIADSKRAVGMIGGALGIELHRQRLIAIAEEMGATLMRAAFSPNIKERKDYSCAVFDGQGRLLCHAAHIPVHLGSTPLSVRAAIDAVEFSPNVSAILNDPYAGGTHLPDVTVVTPVYIEHQSVPAFYVANRAHHADVGGRVPGSLAPLRTESGECQEITINDEGIRISPVALTETVRRRFVQASRLPEERYGDLRAQEAANHVGTTRLHEWVDGQDLGQIQALNQDLLAYSERRMRAVIGELADGEYAYEDYLDDDGGIHRRIPLPVTLRVDGDNVALDFTRAPDAVPGPLNAVRAIVLSAVFYCFRCLAGASIPANEGLMRPIRVFTRRGSILDANEPSAVALGNVETSQRLVDTIFGALALAAPNLIPAASAGTMNNVLFGGTDHRGAVPRAFVHYETLAGGAGAGPEGPGADALQLHMTNTLNTPVEAMERAFPILIRSYAIRQRAPVQIGSHGGGAGIIRHYQFLTDTTVTIMGDRRTTKPYGLHGGADGMVGYDEWSADGQNWTPLPSKSTLLIKKGGHLRIHTPNGGSWCHPGA